MLEAKGVPRPGGKVSRRSAPLEVNGSSMEALGIDCVIMEGTVLSSCCEPMPGYMCMAWGVSIRWRLLGCSTRKEAVEPPAVFSVGALEARERWGRVRPPVSFRPTTNPEQVEGREVKDSVEPEFKPAGTTESCTSVKHSHARGGEVR